MKERPILFSGPMVRAILDGRKTMTRRVVTNPGRYGCLTGDCPHERQMECDAAMYQVCPHGQVGDRLWVRESFSAWFQGIHWYSYRGIRDDCAASNVFYRATHPYPADDQKWIPSIHMPRWASRITLEITAVRVEQLQEVSEDDAIAEGLIKLPATGRAVLDKGAQYFSGCWPSSRAAFRYIWDQLNAKRGFDWDQNPWVWVVEFRTLGT